MIKQHIHKVLLTLEVDSRTALFILLTLDGGLHRKGNGNPDRTDLVLVQDVSDEGHFEALMQTVDETIFSHTGVLRLANPQGKECCLSLIFQGNNGIDFSFRVIYGDESEGSPQELAQVLINAVKITEPWYQTQLAEGTTEVKKWWQIWK